MFAIRVTNFKFKLSFDVTCEVTDIAISTAIRVADQFDIQFELVDIQFDKINWNRLSVTGYLSRRSYMSGYRYLL